MTIIILPKRAFDNLADDLKSSTRQALDTFFQVGRDYRRDVEPKVSQEPGPVRRPIEWTSEKQRRAYFATGGFGHGIPYRRKQIVSGAWDYEERRTGNPYWRFWNTNEAATFVIGDDQQKMHQNTGWEYVPAILERDVERALSKLHIKFFKSL
jgi:hypothetical protein